MDGILTFTRIFSDYHLRRGEPTYFVEQLLNNFLRHGIKCEITDVEARLGDGLLPDFRTRCGAKAHTIRSGTYWKVGDKFFPEIWVGKPHVSKIITMGPEVEVKKVWTFECDENGIIKVDGSFLNQEQKAELAKNDGLSVMDFDEWLVVPCRKAGKRFKGQIICWDEAISYELTRFEM